MILICVFCEVSLALFEKVKIIFYIAFNLGQKGFEKNIDKLVRRLVEHFWSATIDPSFKSFGQKHDIYSEPCSLIAAEIMLNLWISERDIYYYFHVER